MAVAVEGATTGHDSPSKVAKDKEGLCGAKKRSGEGNCSRPAGWGTNHLGAGPCKLHLGSTRNHNHAASKELARREVLRLGLLSNEDYAVALKDRDPRDVLADHVWRAEVNVRVLEAMIGDLGPTDGGLYGRTYHHTGDPTGEAKPHVLVQLYGEACDRLTAVCRAASAVGVERWRMDVDKARAERLATTLKAVGSDPELALSAEQRGAFMRVVARALRELSAGEDSATTST